MFWNSDRPEAFAIAHDFTRPKAYHLALVTAGNETRVMVDGALRVIEPEPVPAAVWWQHCGADYVRVQNYGTFADGEDDACTASHLAALDRAGAAPPACDPTGEPSNATAASNAIYPIFSPSDWCRSNRANGWSCWTTAPT